MKSTGFGARLVDSEVMGFVPIMDISDERTEDAADRVEQNQIVQARIVSFNVDRFSVKLSCKSSVLLGTDLAPTDWCWDPDYDMVAHLADLRLQESHEQKSTR
jgi:transcriptional accessory protein Tex/SPT6